MKRLSHSEALRLGSGIFLTIDFALFLDALGSRETIVATLPSLINGYLVK
jgi:hypothetical protein